MTKKPASLSEINNRRANLWRAAVAILIGLVAAGGVFVYLGLFNAKGIGDRTSPEQFSALGNKVTPNTGSGVDLSSPQIQGDSTTAISEHATRIENFLVTEAKSLDLTQVPSREKEIELQAVARQLTEPQINRVIEVIGDLSRPVNERILGVYLLNLNSSLQALQSLSFFAQSELPDLGPITPHSESEIRRNQELSLRFMVIDQLAEVARRSELQSDQRRRAIDLLKQHATQNPSETLRKYAQTTLDELGE